MLFYFSCSKTLSSSEPTDVQENSSDWKDVQRYLGCNDHLKGIDKGKYTAKVTIIHSSLTKVNTQ